MSDSKTMVDLGPATQRLVPVLEGITDAHLDAPTPCPDYTVADLLDHVVGLTQAFTDVATVGAPLGDEGIAVSADNLDPQWRTNLPTSLAALADAWRNPEAWEGMATAGGVTMPAEVMGIVALDEIVVHSWDLAVATGQRYDGHQQSVDVCIGLLSQAGDGDGDGEGDGEGDGNGLFGTPVAVTDDAPSIDRLIGLSGRDPSWTPPA